MHILRPLLALSRVGACQHAKLHFVVPRTWSSRILSNIRPAVLQVRWNSEQSQMEFEKELFTIKRDVALLYRKGMYADALARAQGIFS